MIMLRCILMNLDCVEKYHHWILVYYYNAECQLQFLAIAASLLQIPANFESSSVGSAF